MNISIWNNLKSYSRTNYGIISIILIAFLLRLPNLNESLWNDEVVYSTSFGIGSLTSQMTTLINIAFAPFYRIFMLVWIMLFGESEFSVRFPSLIIGLAIIGLTYGLTIKFSDRKTAYLAAILLGLSPVHVWYSQEATPYMMALFFMLATIYMWFQIKEKPSNKALYLIYFSLFFGSVFTHYYTAVFLLPLSIMSLAEKPLVRNRLLSIHLIIGLIFIMVIGAKYLTGNLITGFNFLRPFTIMEWWLLYFNWFLGGNALWTLNYHGIGIEYIYKFPVLFTVQLIYMFLLIRGLLIKSNGIEKKWQPSWWLIMLLITLPFVLFFLTAVGFDNLYVERYLIYVLPFFIIIIARGITSFSNVRIMQLFYTLAVVISILSYSAMLNKSEMSTVYKQNPDWGSAARYISSQSDPKVNGLVFTFNRPETLEYQFWIQQLDMDFEIRLFLKKNFVHTLSQGDVELIYMVEVKGWQSGFNQAYKQAFDDPRLQLAYTQNFKGVRIYTFEYLESNGTGLTP